MGDVAGQISTVYLQEECKEAVSNQVSIFFTMQGPYGASSNRAWAPLDKPPMVGRKALCSVLGGWKENGGLNSRQYLLLCNISRTTDERARDTTRQTFERQETWEMAVDRTIGLV